MKCVDCKQEIKPGEYTMLVATCAVEGNLYVCSLCGEKCRAEMRQIRQDFLNQYSE